jgi:hypothetical protein
MQLTIMNGSKKLSARLTLSCQRTVLDAGCSMDDYELPINERRSIGSHTKTEHGVYDDEPFETCGLAYYWYQRAVYWKREAHRSEGSQQTMSFEEKHSSGMTVADLKVVKAAVVEALCEGVYGKFSTPDFI